MYAQRNFVASLRPLALFVAISAVTTFAHADVTSEAEVLLNSVCGSCHLPADDGSIDRIDQSRRTPEGWDMTIVRMMHAHGVRMTPEERQTLVKYLADTRGLAPKETAKQRYLLEREFTRVESPESDLVSDTCARCHSYGMIALQRRTEEDWRKLANFHIGQFPTLEIQAGGRDRNWWEIASGEVPEVLGELYPHDGEAWREWLQHESIDASGTWRVVGHRPGWGGYEGVATIAAKGEDRYSLEMQLNYANGEQESAEGEAIIYTGYEWRGSVQQGDEDVRQVFTLSEDGQTLSGRWHRSGVDSIGGRLHAVRNGEGAPQQLLMVEPSHIKAGTTERINLYGTNLSGDVNLGDDIEVLDVLEQSSNRVVVEARASADAADGVRQSSVGGAYLETGLVLYQQVDYLVIEPEEALAYIGGGGGSRPKIPVQFEAVGYTAGPDGEPGTEDDVRLGYMSASWSVGNQNDYAMRMRDVEYAGTLLPNGLYVPGDAGPNPERQFSANNIGELEVTAVIDDGGRQVEASKPFVVTVQRWNDPPIR